MCEVIDVTISVCSVWGTKKMIFNILQAATGVMCLCIILKTDVNEIDVSFVENVVCA